MARVPVRSPLLPTPEPGGLAAGSRCPRVCPLCAGFLRLGGDGLRFGRRDGSASCPRGPPPRGSGVIRARSPVRSLPAAPRGASREGGVWGR